MMKQACRYSNPLRSGNDALMPDPRNRQCQLAPSAFPLHSRHLRPTSAYYEKAERDLSNPLNELFSLLQRLSQGIHSPLVLLR